MKALGSSLVILLLFLNSGLTCLGICDDSTSAKLPRKENFQLFLLVGQSNMAGRGKVEDQDRQPHPRVLMLTKENLWVPAVAPLHFDKPGIVGVGLGRTFGIEIAKSNPDIMVGLIPCAVGGSPISSWEPGGFHAQTKSHPWDDAIVRAKLAMKDGVLKGILWHQGESDAQPELAKVYEQKLHALIARFRKDLGAADVPFIAGQMGQFKERPWSEAKQMVDAAHRNLPDKVNNTAFVDSDGLAHKGDQVHFDTESYRELGRRYAKAFQKLKSQEKPGGNERGQLRFEIERSVARNGFDGKTCWVHARAGAIPRSVTQSTSGNPVVIMTMQKLMLSGSDSRSGAWGKTRKFCRGRRQPRRVMGHRDRVDATYRC